MRRAEDRAPGVRCIRRRESRCRRELVEPCARPTGPPTSRVWRGSAASGLRLRPHCRHEVPHRRGLPGRRRHCPCAASTTWSRVASASADHGRHTRSSSPWGASRKPTSPPVPVFSGADHEADQRSAGYRRARGRSRGPASLSRDDDPAGEDAGAGEPERLVPPPPESLEEAACPRNSSPVSRSRP